MRSISTAARALLGVGTLVGSLALAGVALASRHSERAEQSGTRVTLVEDERCPARTKSAGHGADDRGNHEGRGRTYGDARSERGGPRPLQSSGDGVSQTVEVSVPRVAIIRIDTAGRIRWARTNTGCAPAPDDLVYLVNDDGSLRAAPGFDVTSIRWRGDFRTDERVYQQAA